MKQIFTYVLAGFTGGLLVLLMQWIFWENRVNIDQEYTNYASTVNQINVSPSRSPFIEQDFTFAAKKARPAVVHIASYKGMAPKNGEEKEDFFDLFWNEDFFSNPFNSKNPSIGSGSGVIYTTDGYIITNRHVIDYAGKVEVTLYDNRQFTATLVGVDKPSDLAVLKIDAFDLPNLEIGNSSEAKVGEWVLAVGNPFDLTSTVTAGIISAKGRSINLLKEDSSIETFIQTDAVVNQGNSGGALVDMRGKLLGINTAIATHNGVFSGYSFAIPVDLVTRIVSDIIEYGAYQRGYLGIHIYELDDSAAKKMKVNIAQGVVIEKIIENGAAETAELHVDDIIVGVNGRKIKGIPDLQEIVGTARVGDELELTIRRGKEKKQIPIILQAEN